MNPELKKIIDKARAEYPHWCELAKKGGPDPRAIDHSGQFGHFIRFPRVGGSDNVWCFSTEGVRDHFCKRYGAREVSSEV